jgi:hypothetical protein
MLLQARNVLFYNLRISFSFSCVATKLVFSCMDLKLKSAMYNEALNKRIRGVQQ